jgi:hypothetical protein
MCASTVANEKSIVRVDDPGFETRQGKWIFLLYKSLDRLWVPPNLLFPWFLLGVKAAGE